MFIAGEERFSTEKNKQVSPINTDLHLITYQRGSIQDAEDAIAAAQQAFPGWSQMYWDERVYLLRKAADLIGSRQKPHGSPGRRG